ncbi:MAG: MgtC/SapB family protein [Gemmatimonadaceae bacterium]|nr:MgtC/SapB family protein [Gemmatimonadaceae bacterium]
MVHTFHLDLLAKLAMSVLLGGAIGLERQIAGKPAGLRTNILTCIGAALLTHLSMQIVVGANGQLVGDPARLAAQIITAIGFLGAGTIMHQKDGGIQGLTSAATVFVVAAIGMTVGAGFFIEAAGAGVLVMIVLAGLGPLEHRLVRAHRVRSCTVRVLRDTKFERVKLALDVEGLRILHHQSFDHPGDRVFELRLKGPASQFDAARDRLLQQSDVIEVSLH